MTEEKKEQPAPFAEYSTKSGRKLYLLGDKKAETAVLLPLGENRSCEKTEKEIFRSLSETGKDFPLPLLAGIPVTDWNRELSPWRAPAVFPGEDFGTGAGEFLGFLLSEVVPLLEKTEDGRKRKLFLCGCSLGGLFALWAAYRTDVFSGVGAVSPSVWFPGFEDFSRENGIFCREVYLSLGKKEEKVKNPVLAAVGDAIRRQKEILSEKGVGCVLEWNEGNHFADPSGRLAKAVAHLCRKCGG